MSLSKRKLLNRDDVIKIILDIGGEEGLKIIKSLSENKFISEFVLARKVGIEINPVRSILYKYYAHRIVHYERTRDKRKGWWIYHWKLLPERIVFLLIKQKKERVRKLKEEINDLEQKKFFKCEVCGKTLPLVEAMENNFQCPVCGSMMVPDSSVDERIQKLKEEISVLEKEIEELSVEDNKVSKKVKAKVKSK